MTGGWVVTIGGVELVAIRISLPGEEPQSSDRQMVTVLTKKSGIN
jgi:hypothetical protein